MAKPNSSQKSDKTKLRIMDAASQLFSEKGYAGSTTREIAEVAGVNEVTLFRHFGTKEKLVKAIMDKYGGLAIAENIEEKLSGDYQSDLMFIGQMMMKVMMERNDAMRMAICESGNFPEFQEIVRENPRQLRLMLARYFKNQMEHNVIQKAYPEVLAQAFLGMFFSYSILLGFLGDSLQPDITSDEIVAQFVSLFVLGTLIVKE